MSDDGPRFAPLAQNLLVAVIGPAVAILAGFYIAQSDKVESLGRDVVQEKTMMANLVAIDQKIETDLSAIAGKYVDVLVTIQTLKGNEAETTDEINRIKADAAQSRQDRISDIADLRRQLEEVEKTFAPIRGSGPDH